MPASCSARLAGGRGRRARRRLREVYRLNAHRLRQGYDIILVARGRTGTVAWKELNDTFLRLCRKLDLLEERT